MKVKEKTNNIHFPVFHYTVEVVITDDITESRKNRQHIYGVYNDKIPTLALHSHSDYVGQCSLFFNKQVSISSIGHECTHAIDLMFTYIGATEIDTEIRAYHSGYLLGQICKMLGKK